MACVYLLLVLVGRCSGTPLSLICAMQSPTMGCALENACRRAILNMSLLWDAFSDAFIVVIQLERRKNEWESMAECIPSGIVTVSFLHSPIVVVVAYLAHLWNLHPAYSNSKSPSPKIDLWNLCGPLLKLAKKKKQQVSNVSLTVM